VRPAETFTAGDLVLSSRKLEKGKFCEKIQASFENLKINSKSFERKINCETAESLKKVNNVNVTGFIIC
jgi:hypothetical protein